MPTLEVVGDSAEQIADQLDNIASMLREGYEKGLGEVYWEIKE